MNDVFYHKGGEGGDFSLEYDEKGRVTSLKNKNDIYGMDWVKKGEYHGEVSGGANLKVSVLRDFVAGELFETFVFQNETEEEVAFCGTDISIRLPLPDFYTDAEECMKRCCNTHIWCGGSSSYVCALRMGGEAPNLGLILKRGALGGYSVERRTDGNVSNDRGTFFLHPEGFTLAKGESFVLSWKLFWFENRAEFEKKLAECEGFINIRSEKYVLFEGEEVKFSAACPKHCALPRVTREGKDVPFLMRDGEIFVREKTTGEAVYTIEWDKKRTEARFITLKPLDYLAERRCRHIAENSQCLDEKSPLYGAYLIYDNEEGRVYYSHTHDHNAGRERVGMGLLMAKFLQKHPDAELEKSLMLYRDFVLRELFDEETGEVFNDVGRNNDWKRLYNYPWYASFFLEMYNLCGEERYLDFCCKALKSFYNEGGAHFYAIAVPMEEAVVAFSEAGRDEEARDLMRLFREHADYILSRGTNYPAHEVDYEQSIVAPAAECLLALYRLTGEEKYKQGAREQLKILELFHGRQPDYRLNGAAIRHWDGYWFGKRKMLGDTFPHYWSALTGMAFMKSGIDEYEKEAEKIIRCPLSLIQSDGSASCAFVYPMSVNGRRAHFYDPWANDQDWAPYMALCAASSAEKIGQ